MTIDAKLKGLLRRLAQPLWRRIRVRIEAKLMPIEDRLATVEDRILYFENHFVTVENRLATLENNIIMLDDRISPFEDRLTKIEAGWYSEMPAFMNAISTVGAFGHELVHVRHDLEEKISELRRELDAVGRDIQP